MPQKTAKATAKSAKKTKAKAKKRPRQNPKRVNLPKLFADLQQELAARLGTTRRNVFHPGAKGEATEEDWRGLLRDYLPQRYDVSKGFVIDCQGKVSHEIDVIIHDRHYSPLLFHHRETRYVPAESVYAVFEVKPDLSRKYVLYAGKKAASVRRLKRTNAKVAHILGVSKRKELVTIAAGILTTSTRWKPGGSDLKKALEGLAPTRRLQLGCVATAGAFANLPDKKLEVSKQGCGLVFFFMRLLEILQQQGTASALDYSAYFNN